MSVKKLHLGKSRDSRTRQKPKPRRSVQSQILLLEQYKNYSDWLFAKDYSNASVSHMLRYLHVFKSYLKKEGVEETQISYNDATAYIHTLKAKNKQRSIQVHINAIKVYFHYLLHQEAIADNPFSNIQIKGIKRKLLYNILSKQELKSLYSNFKMPDSNDKNKNQNWFKTALLASQRNKIIIGLLIYQGLKTEELAGIELSDVKLREGSIFIAGTRRSNERTLQLESHQILDLMEYVQKTRIEILRLSKKQSTQLIVSTGQGERIQNTMQKLTQKLIIQMPGLSNIKQLRASVITHWLKHYNLREVQYRAGHRFVSTTEGYLMNDIEDLLKDVVKYHPIG